MLQRLIITQKRPKRRIRFLGSLIQTGHSPRKMRFLRFRSPLIRLHKLREFIDPATNIL